MDGQTLVRLGAVLFVAFAITATAIEMSREGEPPAAATASKQLRPIATDPLRWRQRQCQQLGEAAIRDPECLAVWAESRDRFLGKPLPDAKHDSQGQ
ncbi:putative entry exclusion protein TrbK-alt [Oryzicola mucosus]|uniref:Putative entry exclusion protein TrbK-alt n=1 Tax=Oryzicola mucosus TaxID=2767425 RepID=A0A8J6U1Z6_9HYPH|nr:putative entry exclusion protein TrbK-alt [Oryzicola mucosus]MBD0417536.1 putative entry exclusion protein TrbK-alt [Oryzicola mucosus]